MMMILRIIGCISFLAAALSIAQGGEIKGKVLTAILEKAMPESIVRLKGPLHQESFVLNGVYGFRNLPAGEYIVSASVNGYTTQQTTIIISDSSVDTLDFRLESSKCPNLSAEHAERDLLTGTPKLYFGSGIVGYRFTDDDRDFEDDYGIKFVDLGCLLPPGACYEAYNAVIVAHLDRSFGYDWREDISIPYFGIVDEQEVH